MENVSNEELLEQFARTNSSELRGEILKRMRHPKKRFGVVSTSRGDV